jgi:hypothetical protein
MTKMNAGKAANMAETKLPQCDFFVAGHRLVDKRAALEHVK